jgi:hypothetical protein
MSCASGPDIIENNLKLYLDAANSKSYPGSGITWTDLMGTENATLTSCTFESTSKGGIVNTSGSYIHIPIDNFTWMGTDDFTIETFVRSDASTHPNSRHPFRVFHTVTLDTTPGWSCGHTLSNNSTEIMCCDGTNRDRSLIAHSELLEGEYYHRVFTVSRTAGVLTKYYINGEYIGQADAPTVTGSIYNATADFGGSGLLWGYVWGWRFTGSINVLKVYNKILTDDEIQQNHTALRHRFNL